MNPVDVFELILSWRTNHYVLIGGLIVVLIFLFQLSAANSISRTITYNETIGGTPEDPEDEINDIDIKKVRIICPETKEVIFSDRAKTDDFDYYSSDRQIDYYKLDGKCVTVFTGQNLVVIEDE